ncbi:hypothetical protein EW145_g3438 [Phellinidium pouzarii]|uniref:Uncharacterized protein n=1 Tax=Phellinidium pouzarii TaxID=167371 RepID=A0A4S4L7I2_9AGAM|nr:hypothetical protein EW145_g3438 [Phellinidium pouzarii]
MLEFPAALLYPLFFSFRSHHSILLPRSFYLALPILKFFSPITSLTMPESSTSLARPELAFPSISYKISQSRYVYPNVDHLPRKYFHFARTSKGRMLGSDWSMTTFDDRKDDQFFDPTRLQTIEETSEVPYFLPFMPLECSSSTLSYDDVEYVSHRDAPVIVEKLMDRLFGKTKSALLNIPAYEVPFADNDYNSQACSGMWGGSKPYINVSFDADSKGQLAMVIYEWKDSEFLGKPTSTVDDTLPKTYICTSDAVRGGFCNSDGLGKFIIDLPAGKSLNETSFWTARVGFRSNGTTSKMSRQDSGPTSPGPDVLWYDEPIQYPVRKTGYFCVAIVPVTVLTDDSPSRRQADTDVPFHPSYNGVILFQNTFDGKLPASEYPKVNFYFALFLTYSVMASVWGWLCYKYREELLPLQYYLSSLVGLLVIEMIANWAYYRYLNAHGRGTVATVFLFVVAILDAGRNALSFFMLLVVSLGLSVVRESLGRTMLKCKILAVAHFVFGVLYAVGIVELELESTSALVLLLFVIPLAFTLSGFLLWIMYALNGTIAQLAARKQRAKLAMFTNLHRILMTVVLVIAIFFVVSSLSFSNRLAEDFAPNTWKVRWWLLDGWLALLYFVAFTAICFIWRPTLHNRR